MTTLTIKPLRNRILVTDLEFGEYIRNGLIIPGDDGRDGGIRPRWARVYAIGEDIQDITVDEWILIEHGRWTRKMVFEENDLILHAVEPEAVILASIDDPRDNVFTTGIDAHGS